jgi:hypothetical protein
MEGSGCNIDWCAMPTFVYKNFGNVEILKLMCSLPAPIFKYETSPVQKQVRYSLERDVWFVMYIQNLQNPIVDF